MMSRDCDSPAPSHLLLTFLLVTFPLLGATCSVDPASDAANCKSRGLTDVPQTLPDTTQTLDLSYNQIATLRNHRFISLSELSYLNLKSNRVSSIEPEAFHGLAQLKTLDLSSNQLPRYPPFSSACASLQTLYLGGNALANADNHLTCLQRLESLYLNHNILHTLPDLSAVSHSIQILDVCCNKMTSVSASDFAPMVALTQLYLRNNHLQSCDALAGMREEAWAELPGNQIVDLASCLPYGRKWVIYWGYNHITHVPNLYPHCATTTRVMLEANTISSIAEHAFDNCTLIRELFLQHNRLTRFPDLTGPKDSLQTVHVYNNVIREIQPQQLDMLTALQHLNVKNNLLTEFPNVAGPSATLTELHLSANPLPAFPKLDLLGSSLRVLALEDIASLTALRDADLAGLGSLQELLLARTSIPSLPALPSLPPSLTLLDLQGSAVWSVAPALMMSLDREGFTLRLADTPLHKLPSTCGNVSSALDLSGTALHLCSCDMLWLKTVWSDSPGITLDLPVTCSGLDWQQASLQQLYDQCPPHQPESNRKDTFYGRVTGAGGCAFPLASGVLRDVTRIDCLITCSGRAGCLGVNFRSTGSGGGDEGPGECVLVAQDPSPSAPKHSLPEGDWTYYPIED